MNKRILIFLVLMLTTPASSTFAKCGVPTTHRGNKARVQFMKTVPICEHGTCAYYPHGKKGWVVDHKFPLCKGGPDTPENMQWQTTEEAKKKDKVECDCLVPPYAKTK